MTAPTRSLPGSGEVAGAVFAATPPWRCGQLLNDRYLITGIIGEGGMGRVYRVRDALYPERDVALKTLACVPAERAELLAAEFRTMATLAHPGIVRVHDFERITGSDRSHGGGPPPRRQSAFADRHAFTMEYIAGRDLWAASEGASVDQVIAWLVEACRALRYLHRRGVIHADFKPHNVLVTRDGAIKVLDFGLSDAGAGRIAGTPAYMAPELRAGRRADARSDLYALGVTLYQLIHRALPSELATRPGACEPLMFRDGAVDARVRGVIERLCAPAPEDRFAAIDQVIDALAAATGRAYAAETAETRRSYVSAARLVGRDAARRQLVDHGVACSAGHETGVAILATVRGASGVGKSRLVREVRRELQLAGIPVVETRCYEDSFAELEPLRAWSEALLRLGRAHGGEALETRHAATLDWLRGEAPPCGASADAVRMDRLRDLVELVLAVSRSVGMVLCIDDLQWARTSTTDFLALLCRVLRGRRDAGHADRLAVIASYRDDEVAGRPIEELLAAVPGAQCLALPLAPLSPDQTEELVASMLGDVPAAFTARVAADTGGNPFFIEETLRALMERGDIYLQAGQWAARVDPAHLDLPSTIAAVLARRLAAVTASQRALIEWLAVYSQPMPLSVLACTSGLGLDAAVAGVQALIDRGLVTHVDPGRVRPAHDRLREYVYDGLAPARRRRWHGVIARTLEATAGDREHVFACAHHYAHAGDDDRAYLWSERAARLAEHTFAIDVAIDNYERLRTLAQARGDDARRVAATDRLLELCTLTGRYDRMRAITRSELGRRVTPLERARLLQLEGEALGAQGHLADGLDRLRRAVATLGGAVPTGRARRLFLAWHYVRHVAAVTARRELVIAERLDVADRRRREILGFCYLLMSVYAMLTGDDEGIAVSLAGINAALPLGDHPVLGKLLRNVALVHHATGRFRLSERLIREARRMASTEADRADLASVEALARMMTQRPMYPGQPPVHAYEARVIDAIELLSSRSKTLYAHMARSVATTIVWQYAPRCGYRPEVSRWAEAMHGTVHHAVVEGAAAVLAYLDGQIERADAAHARYLAGEATPFYRAWIDANLAWAAAIAGDRVRALRCLASVRDGLGAMHTRTAMSLWVPALTLGVCLALEARGAREPWLRPCLREALGRLERARLAPGMEIYREAGRLVLGRSSVAALARARRRALAVWSREETLAAHSYGLLIATLALRAAGRPEHTAWGRDALALIEPRFPASYAGHVRRLVTEHAP